VAPVRDCRDNLLYFADLSKHPNIDGKLPLTQIVHKFEADYEVSNNSICPYDGYNVKGLKGHCGKNDFLLN
jgi:hypothetical protein